jgi:hypothetical protein
MKSHANVILTLIAEKQKDLRSAGVREPLAHL